MQIEIMRHHGGAEDAERQIQHLAVGENVRGRREALEHRAPIGIGHRDLHRKTRRDHAQHRHHEGFDPAKAERLQRQNQKHVGGGDDHADLERNVKQQIEADRGADHFGKVGRGDGDFRRQPQRQRHKARKGIAAGLGEIAPGADAEPRAQRLQHDRHHVGQQRDRQQRVAEFGAAGERGRPVAGIHIADRDEITGPRNASSLRQNGPCLAVLTEANMPASDGSPRAERQPEPSSAGSRRQLGRGIRGQIGRSCIHPERWRIFLLYCNSFATASRSRNPECRFPIAAVPKTALSGSGWFRPSPRPDNAGNTPSSTKESAYVRARQ
jgi:hypothetical protein